MQINFGTAQVIRGWKSQDDFSVTISAVTQPSGASVQDTATVKDCTYVRQSYAGSMTTAAVSVSNVPANPAVWYESLNPTVCAVDHNTGAVTALTTGAATIRVHGQTGYRDVSMVNAVAGASVSYSAINAIAAGSLRKYLLDQQAAALTGVTPGQATQCAYVNGTDPTGGVNTSCFIRAQGKTGFVGLPLDLLDQMLLSADHYHNKVWLTPHHYITGIGATHGTTASTGTSYRLVGTDTVVWYSATPWAGTLAKLLPANYKTYMPDVLTPQTETPCFARLYNSYNSANPNLHGMVQPVTFTSAAAVYPRIESNPYPVNDSRRSYQKYDLNLSPLMVNGGDSGSPMFFGINGAFVIFSFISTQGTMGTDDLALLGAAINTAMNSLATANSDVTVYAALTVDLSSFPAY